MTNCFNFYYYISTFFSGARKNVIHVDYQATAIEEAIRWQIRHGKYGSSKLYGNGTAGQKIVDILATVELKIQKRLTYL